MDDTDLCGISVVSFPIGTAFSVPISNLSRILSATNETHVIIGAFGQIHFQESNDLVRIHSIPYQPGSSMIMRILKYAVLELKVSSKLFSLRKKFQSVIFFNEFPPLLPMITAKIFNNKVYWLLPSKNSLSPNSILCSLIAVPSKVCYNLCTSIILYSTSLISFWNLEPYRQKIRIAHEHFLNLETFTVTTPLAARPPLIGYIGRLSWEKGVQHLARALPAILNDRQDLRVLIGGDGALKETIAAFLQEEGLTIRVDLPGWISHDDLPKYFNQLRLLVLPSYTEGLPNIVLEAMACGTPVLAAKVGAIPDIITDGKTGFIMENNSPECIAENVIRALNTPNLEEISENGRKFVEENFTFESAVARWNGVLKV